MTRGGDDPYGFELRTVSPTRPVRGRLSDGRLYVDLVPTSAWLSNLQAELAGLEWRSCSAYVAARAAHQCEVCGSRRGRLECHERWSFDEVTGIQRLTSLQALCTWCHLATHVGTARSKAEFRFAASHMCRVNGWGAAQFREHLQHAIDVCQRRSGRAWMVDARHLQALPINWSDKTREFVERHATLLQRVGTGDGRQQCIRLLSGLDSRLSEKKGE